MSRPIPARLNRGFYRVLLCAGFLLLPIACQGASENAPPPLEGADAVTRLGEASLGWDEAHNASDLSRLMQLYADSAASMPYNRPALEGRAAIEADFRDFFANFTAEHRTTILSQEVVDNWAIERGHYELTITPKSGDPASRESGKHIVVRKRVGGEWKIQWEIWNTDAPPPPM